MNRPALKHRLLGYHNDDVFKIDEGTPPFSSFIADKAFEVLSGLKNSAENNIWDPYCGNGIILRTIAILHPRFVSKLFGSDIRSSAVDTTNLNLQECIRRGGKSDEYRRLLEKNNVPQELDWTAFCHDVLEEKNSFISNDSIDLVLTDPPYSDMESYFEQDMDIPHSMRTISEYLPLLLSRIRLKLRTGALIGLVLDNGDDYRSMLEVVNGYGDPRRHILHQQYKNRILYTARSLD